MADPLDEARQLLEAHWNALPLAQRERRWRLLPPRAAQQTVGISDPSLEGSSAVHFAHRLRTRRWDGDDAAPRTLPTTRAKIETFECIVCFNGVNARPCELPCRHAVVCDACLLALVRWACPLCRRPID